MTSRIFIISSAFQIKRNSSLSIWWHLHWILSLYWLCYCGHLSCVFFDIYYKSLDITRFYCVWFKLAWISTKGPQTHYFDHKMFTETPTILWIQNYPLDNRHIYSNNGKYFSIISSNWLKWRFISIFSFVWYFITV